MIKKIKVIIWKFIFSFKRYANEKPVFIVGCGHSGTTLMIRILSEAKEVYSIDYESNVFRNNWIDYRTIKRWIDTQRKQNLKLFVEKTPSHVRQLDKIFTTFPKAKVIVLVRDGRDVVLSLEKRTENLQASIERWVSDNEYWLNKYKDDKRLTHVRLEDFTKNSTDTLKKICEHANIIYENKLLDYSNKEYQYQNSGIAQSDGTDANHQLNRNWQVNQPIFKDTNRWKKEKDTTKLDEMLNNRKFIELMKHFQYIN